MVELESACWDVPGTEVGAMSSVEVVVSLGIVDENAMGLSLVLVDVGPSSCPTGSTADELLRSDPGNDEEDEDRRSDELLEVDVEMSGFSNALSSPPEEAVALELELELEAVGDEKSGSIIWPRSP